MNKIDELKQQIIDSPHDESVWLIYSDYLQAHNMIQGHLIALHFAYQIQDNKKRSQIYKAIEKLIQTNASQWHANYWPSFQDTLNNGQLGPKMMIIPKGSFWMGSREKEAYRKSDEILHIEEMKQPFAISQYTISQAEYHTYMSITQQSFDSKIKIEYNHHPQVNISFYEADRYCHWLSKQSQQYYRLPTEIEWEYSARADIQTSFWWGDLADKHYSNYQETSIGGITKIDAYYPNPWGLYQVHGNVWEWTCSGYSENYEHSRYCFHQLSDIPSPLVVRGGAWISHGSSMRLAHRERHFANERHDDLGFRICRDS